MILSTMDRASRTQSYVEKDGSTTSILHFQKEIGQQKRISSYSKISSSMATFGAKLLGPLQIETKISSKTDTMPQSKLLKKSRDRMTFKKCQNISESSWTVKLLKSYQCPSHVSQANYPTDFSQRGEFAKNAKLKAPILKSVVARTVKILPDRICQEKEIPRSCRVQSRMTNIKLEYLFQYQTLNILRLLDSTLD